MSAHPLARSLFLAALLVAGLCRLLPAQALESEFRDRLLSAPPDSVLTVLVAPAIAVELQGVDRDLRQRPSSRRERHRRVVGELRSRSRAAQQPLLSRLDQGRGVSRVREVRPYWIANLVAVTATVEQVLELAQDPAVGNIHENRALRLQAGEDQAEPPAGNPKRKSAAPAAGLSSLEASPSLAATGYFNWALDTLRVRPLWGRGLTGKGILVGIIDSGVDGAHPALAGQWRGANGATVSESWFDPWKTGSYFPVDDDPSIGPTHGTKVLGCILGRTATDTIGVAPGAQWIAANGFENTTDGVSGPTDKLLACFQWMADPDGDEQTIDDVPDVLNLSFADGSISGCLTVYWAAIDNLELLGVIPIIAAGNKSFSIGAQVGSPASNPNFFAVGSIDPAKLASSFATAGPSTCDPSRIKPDVTAPGEQFLTSRGSLAGGGYGEARGSSFSAPLVAGIAVLLKQYNPELLPNQVLEAIRGSARDLGSPGPDNSFGWGLVDASAALGRVAPAGAPAFSILSIVADNGRQSEVTPGDVVSVVLRLTNNGSAAQSVAARLISSESDLVVRSGQSSFGNLLTGAEATNSTMPFVVEVGAGIAVPALRTLRLELTAGSFSQALSFALNVGGAPETPVESTATHDLGQAGLTLSNYGMIGRDGLSGGGFVYPRGASGSKDHLFTGALLVGNGQATVSDASYAATAMDPLDLKFEHDFTVAPEGTSG